jgi:hypothetical protein
MEQQDRAHHAIVLAQQRFGTESEHCVDLTFVDQRRHLQSLDRLPSAACPSFS